MARNRSSAKCAATPCPALFVALLTHPWPQVLAAAEFTCELANSSDDGGTTALHMVIRSRMYLCVCARTLIATVLFQAAGNGHPGICQVLLEVSSEGLNFANCCVSWFCSRIAGWCFGGREKFPWKHSAALGSVERSPCCCPCKLTLAAPRVLP
jgi:hypothetical protein